MERSSYPNDSDSEMLSWINSDNEHWRDHARKRAIMRRFDLADSTQIEMIPEPIRAQMHADSEYLAAQSGVKPVQAFFPEKSPVWVDQVNSCLYRECRTGCQQSLCFAGYGERYGPTEQPEPYGHITLANCKDCMKRMNKSESLDELRKPLSSGVVRKTPQPGGTENISAQVDQGENGPDRTHPNGWFYGEPVPGFSPLLPIGVDDQGGRDRESG